MNAQVLGVLTRLVRHVKHATTQNALANHATKRNNPYLIKTDQTHPKKKALGDVKSVGPKPTNIPTLGGFAKSNADRISCS